MESKLGAVPLGRPKPQKERDLAFSRRSLVELDDGSGCGSLPPNLYPAGIGAPLRGPEIFTLLSEDLSGDGTRSEIPGEGEAPNEGW